MTPTRILQRTPTIIAALIIGLIGLPILFVTGAVMMLQCHRTTNQCQLITTYPIGSSTQSVPLDQIQSATLVTEPRGGQHVELQTSNGARPISVLSSDHPQADLDHIVAFLHDPTTTSLSIVTQDNRWVAYPLGLLMGGVSVLLLISTFGNITVTFDKSISVITFRRRVLVFERVREFTLSHNLRQRILLGG